MTDAVDTTRPLSHIRVLDLSRMFPGAYCTLMLADLGADVLKVEVPGAGDGLRFMTPEPFPAAHVALNRGKRSMTLNLKSPAAPDLLRRLVRDADVLVESARPGAMDKLGLGFEDLRQDNPALVWCSLTGFGSAGPNAQAPGHDLTYAGYAGLLSTLTVNSTPTVPATSLTFPLAGLMGAYGILAALSGRERTGVGSRVEANMVDSTIWMLSEQLARAANAPGPAWGSVAARANYQCADGRWVTCTASEPRSWSKLVEALEAPDITDYSPGVNEAATATRLTQIFGSRPQSYWLQNPGLAGGIGPIWEPADLVSDSQLSHRRAMVAIEDDGPLVFANPLRIDGALGDQGTHARGAPPSLGEHTDAVLFAAGLSTADIDALREGKTV